MVNNKLELEDLDKQLVVVLQTQEVVAEALKNNPSPVVLSRCKELLAGETKKLLLLEYRLYVGESVDEEWKSNSAESFELVGSVLKEVMLMEKEISQKLGETPIDSSSEEVVPNSSDKEDSDNDLSFQFHEIAQAVVNDFVKKNFVKLSGESLKQVLLTLTHRLLMGNCSSSIMNSSRCLFDRGKYKLKFDSKLRSPYGMGFRFLDRLYREITQKLVYRSGYASNGFSGDSIDCMLTNEGFITTAWYLCDKMLECEVVRRLLFDQEKQFEAINRLYILAHITQVTSIGDVSTSANDTRMIFDRGRELDGSDLWYWYGVRNNASLYLDAFCYDSPSNSHLSFGILIFSLILLNGLIFMDTCVGKSVYELNLEVGYTLILLIEHSNVSEIVKICEPRDAFQLFNEISQQNSVHRAQVILHGTRESGSSSTGEPILRIHPDSSWNFMKNNGFLNFQLRYGLLKTLQPRYDCNLLDRRRQQSQVSYKFLVDECVFINVNSSHWIYDRGNMFDRAKEYFSWYFADAYEFCVDTSTSRVTVLIGSILMDGYSGDSVLWKGLNNLLVLLFSVSTLVQTQYFYNPRISLSTPVTSRNRTTGWKIIQVYLNSATDNTRSLYFVPYNPCIYKHWLCVVCRTTKGYTKFEYYDRMEIIQPLLTVTHVSNMSKLMDFLKWKFKLVLPGFWSMRNYSWVCKTLISVVSLVVNWNHMSHLLCKAVALYDYLLQVSTGILENGDVSQIALLERKHLFMLMLTIRSILVSPLNWDCPTTSPEVCQITQVRRKYVKKVQYPYGIVLRNFCSVQYLACHSQWWGISGATVEANMELKLMIYLRWESNWLSTGFWSVGTLLRGSFSGQVAVTNKSVIFQIMPTVIRVSNVLMRDDYLRWKVTTTCYAKLGYVLERWEFVDKLEKNFRSSEIVVKGVGVQVMTVESTGSGSVSNVSWVDHNFTSVVGTRLHSVINHVVQDYEVDKEKEWVYTKFIFSGHSGPSLQLLIFLRWESAWCSSRIQDVGIHFFVGIFSDQMGISQGSTPKLFFTKFSAVTLVTMFTYTANVYTAVLEQLECHVFKSLIPCPILGAAEMANQLQHLSLYRVKTDAKRGLYMSAYQAANCEDIGRNFSTAKHNLKAFLKCTEMGILALTVGRQYFTGHTRVLGLPFPNNRCYRGMGLTTYADGISYKQLCELWYQATKDYKWTELVAKKVNLLIAIHKILNLMHHEFKQLLICPLGNVQVQNGNKTSCNGRVSVKVQARNFVVLDSKQVKDCAVMKKGIKVLQWEKPEAGVIIILDNQVHNGSLTPKAVTSSFKQLKTFCFRKHN